MVDITPLRMTTNDALNILKKCAGNDSLVFISPHARERMAQRHITRKQVLLCLEKGKITESPCRDIRGDWKCTVEHYTSGNVVTVAAVIKYNESGERTVIVTVF